MRSKARGLWVLLALAMLFVSGPARAQDTDAEEIRTETEKALEGGDIQRDAPLAERVRSPILSRFLPPPEIPPRLR